MSLIQIKNLTFRYDNGIENIFDDVSVNLDTNWKLGLIGRNGKGKGSLYCHPDQQRDPADICEGMERNVCQTV